MEVISQQSSLERQLSSISGSELRLGLYFWRAAAGALFFFFPRFFFRGRAGGRGLMRGKCLAARAVPFSCVSLRSAQLVFGESVDAHQSGLFAAAPRTQMASLVSSPLRYPAAGLRAIKPFQSRGTVRSKKYTHKYIYIYLKEWVL